MTGRRLFWATLFSVAMGYFEAAVVVYLRRPYYPGGFEFPPVQSPPAVVLVELGPVLAPLLVSVLLVGASPFILRSEARRVRVHLLLADRLAPGVVLARNPRSRLPRRYGLRRTAGAIETDPSFKPRAPSVGNAPGLT